VSARRDIVCRRHLAPPGMAGERAAAPVTGSGASAAAGYDSRRRHRASPRIVRPDSIGCIVHRPGEAGQASVELVAFLPLVLLIALAVFSFVAAQAAREEAGAAAEAGALALLQGRDAHEAAQAALSPASRARARITVSGTSVRVHLRAHLPLLANRLAATEEANAGA
jgi:hypothetical protein